MARYKVSFYCDETQVGELTGRVIKDVQGFSVVKGNPDKPPGPSYMEREPVKDPDGYVVGYTKISQPRVAGGRKSSQSEPGRIILRLFDDLTVAHPVDICNALKKAGYAPTSYGAICAGLIAEGMLYRASRGAYRRPTSLEEAKVG